MTTSTASNTFGQLLQAAASQPEPQRLLFVFAAAELPDGATAQQRRRFAAGQGGALTPLACVDKDPADLTTFEALSAESRAACPPWDLVFIAALGGQSGRPPSSGQVEAALQTIVKGVQSGRLGAFLALDAAGEPVRFS
ncbi:ribonucleotide reductase subunit alpha [Ramlibacter sp.]|uniref:ribonucleotide reductase subunit alpha n=1 Tax=Ramlibacter sp. TaxID=1917967 RepID=UPI002C811998|nr:ribonucleotide reductase subunit alpha [Ramlibacter sp.]HWI80735.1 ribonucleotide reductase subunit alpha [Ramlibacter sp.]